MEPQPRSFEPFDRARSGLQFRNHVGLVDRLNRDDYCHTEGCEQPEASELMTGQSLIARMCWAVCWLLPIAGAHANEVATKLTYQTESNIAYYDAATLSRAD